MWEKALLVLDFKTVLGERMKQFNHHFVAQSGQKMHTSVPRLRFLDVGVRSGKQEPLYDMRVLIFACKEERSLPLAVLCVQV